MEDKPKIPLILKSATYKIVIPAKVERLIRFLCERVWDTEWSGVLFYTPSGTFENGDLEIHCEDIYPMDIGTTTYTEFNMSPDVIGYMAQNPELLDCKMGLIHSHNNMSAFFSGTDVETLREEGAERNHFVSLIVNNAGKYDAAITRKIKYKAIRELSYDSFDGPVESNNKEIVEGEELEYFKLDIVFEETPENNFVEVAERLSEIKKNKSASRTTSNASTGAPIWTKQGSLFKDDDWDSSPVTKYTYYSTYNKKSPKDGIVDDSIVEGVVNQLLTGSVTLTKLTPDTKQKVINTIATRFDHRFGDSDYQLIKFEFWATDFIEFLLWYSVDDPEVDEQEAAEEISKKAIAKLKKLPQNKYISKYIDILTTYSTKL